MAQHMEFGLIGKEDLLLEPRNGCIEITLSDGRAARLHAVDIGYLLADSFQRASLPRPGIVGRLARVLDDAEGLWMDTGVDWRPVVSFGLPSYSQSALPVPGVAGRLARVADSVRGIWVDAGTQWLPLTRITDIRDFGARGDGTADDAPAIQAAIDAVRQVGGGSVYVPAGRYRLATTAGSGGVNWHLYIGSSNVCLIGDGDASILASDYAGSDEVYIVHVMGNAKRRAPTAWRSGHVADVPVSAIRQAVAGAFSVTLESPRSVAAFSPGSWVIIRTGQTLRASSDEPDAELNVVASVDQRTGVIRLRYPLAKDYAPEAYPSGHRLAGSPAPFGIGSVDDRMIENVHIERIRLEGSRVNGIHTWNVSGVSVTRCSGTVHKYFQGGTWYREGLIAGNRVHTLEDGWWAAVASTCSDVTIRDNVFSSSGRSFIHVHEGPARIKVLHNYCFAQSSTQLVSVRARAYDIEIAGNMLVNDTTSRTDNCIFVDPTCRGGGVIYGNIIRPGAGQAIRIQADTGWQEFGNRLSAVGMGVLVNRGNADIGPDEVFLEAPTFSWAGGESGEFRSTHVSGLPAWIIAGKSAYTLIAASKCPSVWIDADAYVYWSRIGTGQAVGRWSIRTRRLDESFGRNAGHTARAGEEMSNAPGGAEVVTTRVPLVLTGIGANSPVSIEVQREKSNAVDGYLADIAFLGVLLRRVR